MVNRVWDHFFGEGFVHPVNAWDLGRLNPEIASAHDAEVQPRDHGLLEGLTDFFIGSGYDFKALFRLITNSRVYQADYGNSPHSEAGDGIEYWTSDRRISRIDAEAMADSIFQILEIQPRYTVSGILDRTFSSAWDLPDSSEPNPGALFTPRNGQLADPVDLGYESMDDFRYKQQAALELLTTFGRPDRYLLEERDNTGRTKTALAMMNDETLYRAFLEEGASPFADRLSEELGAGEVAARRAIGKLFVRILFREPSAYELTTLLQHLEDRDPGLAARDLIWVLFNHSDFIYK